MNTKRRDEFNQPIFRNWNGKWLVQMPKDYKFSTGQIVTITKKSGQMQRVVLISSYGNGENLFVFRQA